VEINATLRNLKYELEQAVEPLTQIRHSEIMQSDVSSALAANKNTEEKNMDKLKMHTPISHAGQHRARIRDSRCFRAA
jgi:hypothetical protein